MRLWRGVSTLTMNTSAQSVDMTKSVITQRPGGVVIVKEAMEPHRPYPFRMGETDYFVVSEDGGLDVYQARRPL